MGQLGATSPESIEKRVLKLTSTRIRFYHFRLFFQNDQNLPVVIAPMSAKSGSSRVTVGTQIDIYTLQARVETRF